MQNNSISRSMLSGIFLIGLLFSVLAVTTVLFLFGISISCWNLLFAVICSAAMCFFISNKSLKKTIFATICGILIVALAITMCHHIFDQSYDGNTYHKSMVGLMKLGWNPLKTTFYSFVEDNELIFLSNAKATWYDAYPKMSEIWGACIYIITNYIEDGKSFNLVSTIGVFLIAYSLLKETDFLKRWQSLFCAVLCVLNPVVLSQMFTYYNDGFMWQMILLCLIVLVYLTLFNDTSCEIPCFCLIFMSINIGFNIKFSAIIFYAILCLGFFAYWAVKCAKETKSLAEKKAYIGKRFFVFAVSVFSGVIFTGATSYVINFIRHRNPLYTMIGEGSTEIITAQLPTAYKEMNNVFRFVCSLFSQTNNSKQIETVEWKIPFVFNTSEFLAAQKNDVRTAGWGILFSGIFLLSVFAIWLVFVLCENKAEWKKVAKMLSGMLFVGILFIPGLSWARYCVALFYIPVAAIAFSFVWINRGKRTCFLTYAPGMLAILLLLNMVPNIVKIKEDFANYSKIENEYLELKQNSQNSEVAVCYREGTGFFGTYFTLFDYDIQNIRYEKIEAGEEDGTLPIYSAINFKYVTGLKSAEETIEFFDLVNEIEKPLIIIAVKDEASTALTDEMIGYMQSLGVQFDLKDKYRWSYLAVVDEGKVVYESAEESTLTLHEKIDDYDLSVKSGGYNNGNVASIVIDGKEYAINGRGINIVVIDKKNDYVVDSVRIDTYKDNMLYRKK